MDIYQFWKDVLDQNEDAIRNYFDKNAVINWHCTNERFSVEEFIIANCQYPGSWDGEVERVEHIDDLCISVVHVYPKDKSSSFHVTSFFKLDNGKIIAVDEYWADDGDAPQWRLDMHIGTAIQK